MVEREGTFEPSPQVRRKLLGMLLMVLEQGETCLQERLEFGIVRSRDERCLERTVHGPVECNLILNIGAVEGVAASSRVFSLACLVNASLVALSCGVT